MPKSAETAPNRKQLKQLHSTEARLSEPRTIGAPWSYDFLFDATDDGRRLKWMPIIDEYTRECLALEVNRSMTSTDVIDVLDQLIGERGAPAFIRSDNGPDFVANAVRNHLSDLDVETRFIAPGAPWENGYIESFNGTLRNELLSREVFGWTCPGTVDVSSLQSPTEINHAQNTSAVSADI